MTREQIREHLLRASKRLTPGNIEFLERVAEHGNAVDHYSVLPFTSPSKLAGLLGCSSDCVSRNRSRLKLFRIWRQTLDASYVDWSVVGALPPKERPPTEVIKAFQAQWQAGMIP